jgi:hypothetical protein
LRKLGDKEVIIVSFESLFHLLLGKLKLVTRVTPIYKCPIFWQNGECQQKIQIRNYTRISSICEEIIHAIDNGTVIQGCPSRKYQHDPCAFNPPKNWGSINRTKQHISDLQANSTDIRKQYYKEML